MLSYFIKVSNQIEFIHQYPVAPEEVSFLRYPHRHILHIYTKIQVYNDDRELEFIMVKRKIDSFLDSLNLTENITNISCEQLGAKIIDFIRSNYCIDVDRNIEVTVSEDDENSAVVCYTKENING